MLEYGKPIISKRAIHFKSKKAERKEPKSSPYYGTKNGQVYYIVEFPQDESIEYFDAGYVAQVYIWEDNSKPWSLRLGNSSIMDLKCRKLSLISIALTFWSWQFLYTSPS